MRDMTSVQHGKENFDKEYYSRFFRQNGELDFSTYENWFDGWYRFVKRYTHLQEHAGKKVLELGCAIGAFSKILDKKGFDVTATDISGFILKEAKKHNKDVTFKKVDIEKKINLPQKFDYIFAFEVLEHLNHPRRAMTNIYTTLKKGGVFIFSTPFISTQALKDPTHINVHNPNWWLTLGREAGFSRVKFSYASFLPFLYHWNKIFSIGMPIKLGVAPANSTSFFFFWK